MREIKHQLAIEAIIGHMKTDGGSTATSCSVISDASNALLVAAAHNLQLIFAVLARWRTSIHAEISVKAENLDTFQRSHTLKPLMPWPLFKAD